MESANTQFNARDLNLTDTAHKILEATIEKHKDTKTIEKEQNNPMAVVEFSGKDIIVDIHKYMGDVDSQSNSVQEAQCALTQWIGDVYNELATATFSAYHSRHLSESESKVYFTKNLAANFSKMADYFWKNHRKLWLKEGTHLIGHFQQESSRALEYLLVKYPQKKKAFFGEEVYKAIPRIDRSDLPEFDYLCNTGSQFVYDETKKSYHKKIKLFLNKIVHDCQKEVDNWRKLMADIFIVEEKTLPNMIGMKFRENTPMYS